MRFSRAILVVGLCAATGAAQAAGAGLRIGTTGIGADFGWGLAPTLGARLGVSGGNVSRDVSTDEVSYDAKLKLANVNAFLDWSALGPFRLTAGIIPNDNKVDLTGQPTSGTFTINGTPYSASQLGSLSGTVKSGNSVAPYLGIGYGNVWTKGVNFYFDLGVMFMGSPKVTLTATCGPAATPAQCAQIQNDVEAERLKVQDKVKKFEYYPVANIGITIGF